VGEELVKSPKDSNSDVRQAALQCLSSLRAQGMNFLVWSHICGLLRLIFVAELQQEIWAVNPLVVESLKDSDSYVPEATLKCLSGLGAQGMHSLVLSEHCVAS
jgi:vesicle coat complex subunit